MIDLLARLQKFDFASAVISWFLKKILDEMSFWERLKNPSSYIKGLLTCSLLMVVLWYFQQTANHLAPLKTDIGDLSPFTTLLFIGATFAFIGIWQATFRLGNLLIPLSNEAESRGMVARQYALGGYFTALGMFVALPCITGVMFQKQHFVILEGLFLVITNIFGYVVISHEEIKEKAGANITMSCVLVWYVCISFILALHIKSGLNFTFLQSVIVFVSYLVAILASYLLSSFLAFVISLLFLSEEKRAHKYDNIESSMIMICICFMMQWYAVWLVSSYFITPIKSVLLP
jgi:hypothetical protein